MIDWINFLTKINIRQYRYVKTASGRTLNLEIAAFKIQENQQNVIHAY